MCVIGISAITYTGALLYHPERSLASFIKYTMNVTRHTAAFPFPIKLKLFILKRIKDFNCPER